MQRESTISLRLLPMVLFGHENQDNMQGYSSENSRRVSSASSTSSFPSLPRTPSSARDSHDYYWRDSRSSDTDRLASLREAFDQSECSHEEPIIGNGTPITPGGLLVNPGVERSGWNVDYKSPVRSLSVISPSSTNSAERRHRVTRSASTASSSSSVRPLPQRPLHMPVPEKVIEEELSRLSLYEDNEDARNSSDDETSQPSGSDADGSADASLRRRRHIRRPARAKKETPRRLPPLPGTLVHSHSTAARFAPPHLGSPSNQFIELDSQFDGTGDLRRRSHTISDIPINRVRPLPLPAPPAPLPKQLPQPTNLPANPPKPKVPRLRLATLSPTDPSEAAEANAVLTKTPNRRFNPLGLGGGPFVAPPMPQDASARLDWELIEDMLEADFVDDTPTPIARPWQGAV